MSAKNCEFQPLLDLADAVRAAQGIVGRKVDLDAACAERERTLAALSEKCDAAKAEVQGRFEDAKAACAKLVTDSKAEAGRIVSEARRLCAEAEAEDVARAQSADARHSTLLSACDEAEEACEKLVEARARLQSEVDGLNRRVDELKAKVASL